VKVDGERAGWSRHRVRVALPAGTHTIELDD
jgi:hypothetical protein